MQPSTSGAARLPRRSSPRRAPDRPAARTSPHILHPTPPPTSLHEEARAPARRPLPALRRAEGSAGWPAVGVEGERRSGAAASRRIRSPWRQRRRTPGLCLTAPDRKYRAATMTTTELDRGAVPPEVPGPFGAPVPDREAAATLRADTLNLFDATVVATASVAPAYGLAATMGALYLTAGVGVAGPAVIWVSFVPVLFVAVSYLHLNRRHPDCGAAFAWVGRALDPVLGWVTGWVQLVASALFCILGPGLAGAYTLQLFASWGWVSSSVAQSVGDAALVGAEWLVVVTLICVAGIRWTSNLQWVLLGVEYVAVVVLSLWGIAKVVASHPAGSRAFHWSWLSPFSIGGLGALSAGLVLGVFFFWGWDTAINLNEESKARTRTPGRAGVIAMVLLLGVFLLNLVAAQMLLPASV